MFFGTLHSDAGVGYFVDYGDTIDDVVKKLEKQYMLNCDPQYFKVDNIIFYEGEVVSIGCKITYSIE